MTKTQLNTILNEKVENISTSDLYSSVKNSALNACEQYCAEKGINSSFTLQTDFMNEYIFREAVSTSMKELINLLVDNNLISLDE